MSDKEQDFSWENWMPGAIEKNVPIASPYLTKSAHRQKFTTLESLNVGDSFKVPEHLRKRWMALALEVKKKHPGRNFQSRQIDELWCRLWRVK